MRNIYYVAKTTLIAAILGFIVIHFAAIDAAFVRWLGASPSLTIQCYSMPKGMK